MNTQAGQGFGQPLPNINKDNKVLVENKQNQGVTKVSGKGHKGSNEIDTYQDGHDGSHPTHHDQNAVNGFPGLKQYAYNPYGIDIPQIQFFPQCKKCLGKGFANNKKGQARPCVLCYQNKGYCKKCYGTGTHYLKNVPCKQCNVYKDK